MKDKIGIYQFTANPFHLDCTGSLRLDVLGNHLLNCAGIHAAERGFGIGTLQARHYTWVLSRLALEMERLPKAYEAFSIETWIENLYRKFTDRNFLIRDSSGQPIGYARTVWAMIDMETRQAADLSQLHGNVMAAYLDADADCPIEKVGRCRPVDTRPEGAYIPRYSDLDLNGHVNSIKYIERMLDVFPPQHFSTHRLRRFEIAYMAESHYADPLEICCRQGEAQTYDMEIRRADTREPIVRGRLSFV